MARRDEILQPADGVRNTGEEAMLVGPEHTCGAHIGFVGPKERRTA